MRHHRVTSIAAALPAAVCLTAGPVRADENLFDFEAPGEHQEGEYVVSDGAALASGAALLASRSDPDWWDDAMTMRSRLTIQVLATVDGLRFTVPLDGSAPGPFAQSLPDGADLALVDPDGELVSPSWLAYFNRLAREGDLRVAYAGSLPAGFSDWWLYFGGEAVEHDREAVFAHDPPAGFYMPGDSHAATTYELTLVSFVDANAVTAPGLSTTLDAGETVVIAGASMLADAQIAATGPLFAAFTSGFGDAAATKRLAGIDFALATPRYRERFTVVALDEPATVTFIGTAGTLDSWSVPAGTAVSGEVDVPDAESVTIRSTRPVTVAKHGYDPEGDDVYYDFVIVPPAAGDLIGPGTGRTVVAALEDGTSATAYLSDGSIESFTLDALETRQLAVAGSQGDGPGARIVADKPISAISYADGDGGDMVSYLPTRTLGSDHWIPFDSQYVYVTAPYPGTSCTLTDSSGTPDTRAAAHLAPPYAKRIYWGSATSGANVTGPAHLRCDMPVHVAAERTLGNDETNVWPLRFFRGPEPGLGFDWADELQTRFDPTQTGSVVTPTFDAPAGVVSWTGFEQGGATETPPGTRIAYLLSVDGGSTWLTSWGAEWRAAAGPEEAMSEREVDETIGNLPSETDSLTVQALLSTTDGTVTPVLDGLTVLYEPPGDLDRFEFGHIPSAVTSEVPFGVSLSARDADGHVVVGYEGTVMLFCEPDDAIAEPTTSPAFVDGEVELDLTLSGEGYVTLVALDGAIRGEAGPISVMPGEEPASLVKVGGDDQFGTAGTILPEPVAVQVLDADGGPVAGVEVDFSITEGDGSVTPGSAHTDVDGVAAATWTLGESPGANALVADAGDISGSPAEFVARGDAAGSTAPGSGGGGCGCSIVR
jgi:hypothetical protein